MSGESPLVESLLRSLGRDRTPTCGIHGLRIVRRRCRSCDEQSYADLADELNDPGVPMTVDDFDRRMVAAARAYAAAERLPFPPSTGDFDRWYEERQRRARRGVSPSPYDHQTDQSNHNQGAT